MERKKHGTRRRFLWSLALYGLTILIYALAKYAPDLMFPWYQEVSRKLLRAFAHVTDLIPVSLWEWGGLGVLWLALGGLLKVGSRRLSPGKYLSIGSLGLSVILLIFVGIWGADQFAPTFVSATPYTETEFSPEEAEEAAAYYLDMANTYALTAPRNGAGETDFGEFSSVAAELGSGYHWLEENYGDRFHTGSVRPKGLVFSRLMDMSGLTGIFTAYTGEMGINVNTPDQSLPFVISHECAHRTTVTQEADANFTAFLACIHSESEMYRYSGYYSAFIYCYNAISKVDKEAQSRLWNGMNQQLKTDVLAANAHYAQFDKPVKKAAQKANNSYLKTFNQPTGVRNYGAVAGPLMAYYHREIAP